MWKIFLLADLLSLGYDVHPVKIGIKRII